MYTPTLLGYAIKSLAAIGLVGLIAAFVLAMQGKAVPDMIIMSVGNAIGALAGVATLGNGNQHHGQDTGRLTINHPE